MEDKTSTKPKSNNDNKDQEVRPYDILCGRSKNCFNNIGNRRFRITIGMHVKKYDALHNRTERGKFIATLSLQLKNEVGFRFIRSTKKKGRVELSDKEIQAKIGHALRDLSATLREAAIAAAKHKEEETSKKSATTSEPLANVVTPKALERVVSDDISLNGIKIPMCPKLNNMKMGNANKKKTSLFLPLPEMEEDLQDKPMTITVSSKKKVKKWHNRSPKIPSVICSSSLVSPHEEKSMKFVSPHEEKAMKFVSPHEEKALKFGKLEAAVDDITNTHDHKDIKDDDDYSFTPFRLDDSSQGGILEMVPMYLLPAFASENATSLSRANSLPIITNDQDDGDKFHFVVGLNDEGGRDNTGGFQFFRKANSFPDFHPSDQNDYIDDRSSHMSVSSCDYDDAMIEKSLCDSVDCLSLDLDCA